MFLTYLLIDVGVPKSLLKRFENSMKDIQTFWSPTTKAPDEEAA